jgi:hypothetical protein
MAIHKKKVEFFTVILKTEEDFSFEQLITSSEVVERELRIKGKDVELRILNKGRDTITGLVVTSRNENIPPKKNKKKKTIEKLGLEVGEGLAYANVFIYEKKRKILMYEVNKFGCFVDHFIDYIHRCCKDSENFKSFDIALNSILNANEYQRMLKMRFHKSVELQIANPRQIIADYQHKQDALFNVCSSAASVGSTRLSTKFEVEAKKDGVGLTSRSVKELIDSVLRIFRSPQGDNIKKIQVVGYETDSEDDKLQPIDLIADRYLQQIELDEPRENTDLLEGQRSKQIKGLYLKCIDDFDVIFGK